MKFLKNFDFWLFLPVILILTFGIVVLLSTDQNLAQQQLLFALLGLGLYFLVAFTQSEYFRAFSPLFYVASIILLSITVLIGTVTRGAIRWIPLGVADLTLQTSEISKFLLIVAFSAFFVSSRWKNGLRSFLESLILIGLPTLLIYRQPDLGTTIVVVTIWFWLYLQSGRNLKYLFVLLVMVALLSPLLWRLLQPYQRERVTTFLNPNLDPLGAGYHILQSKIAIGSGQIWGRGFGQGTQSHLKFLPEYHNDFIFATLSEEWGLVGSSILIFGYFFLLFRIQALSQKALDPFEKALCLGTFAMIFTQFSINVGMNLGLAPITGIPLPLVSSGGSSLVATLLSLGLVQSVARHRKMS